MRTWSVSGTALALCTRSSSLSMSTRTSMPGMVLASDDGGGRRLLLLLRAERPAWTAVRVQLAEALRDGRGHEPLDVAAERRDLLHAARGDERELGARHDVHRLDLGGQQVVEAVHLELPLEVGDHAEALHHRPGAVLAREVDDELAEDVDEDVVQPGEGILQERDALLHGEQRLLVLRVADDADDDPIEDRGRAPDHVHMPQRDRVEGPRVDGSDRVAVDGRHLAKRVSRAEPYRRAVTRSSGSAGSVLASVSTTTIPSSLTTSGRRSASTGSSVSQRP